MSRVVQFAFRRLVRWHHRQRPDHIIYTALCLILAVVATPTLAQPRPFEGKIMTFMVGSDVGGGYDTYARTLAPFLERELGAQRVVVQNLPTASGIIALNNLYHGDPDGLTFMTMNTGLLMTQIGGADVLQADMAQMGWIGKASSEARVLLVNSAVDVATFGDIQNRDDVLKFASSRFGSAAHVQLSLLKDVYDLKIDILPGFGGSEAQAALLKGEVQGVLVSEANVPPMLASGHAVPVLVFGDAYSSELADVQRWRDVAETPDQVLVSQQIERVSQLGRLVATSPDTPDALLAELRRAFVAVMQDPAFVERAAQNSLEIDYLDGAAVNRIVQDFLQADLRFQQLVQIAQEP